jgi:hypothetical protein
MQYLPADLDRWADMNKGSSYMKTLHDIEEIVQRLLVEKAKVLNSWRTQDLTTGNRVKNFENWLLVELVHSIRLKKLAKRIKTNGRVRKPSYGRGSASNLLKGRKRNSRSLSPDLSIEILPYEGWIDVDIKTQTSRQEVLDDAKIARFHNENEKDSKYRAALLWVVMEPEDPKLAARVKRSAEGIVKTADGLGLKLKLEEIQNADWLYYSFTTP